MKLPLSYSIFLVALKATRALEGSLSTGFAGTTKVDGNIFEIKTKAYPVTIQRMDIHMTATTAPIQVWYRPGVQSAVYEESYENALDTQITGNGLNALTPLPAFGTPIVLPANTIHTFYVTASKNGLESLYYGMGTELGSEFASDEFVSITEGYAMRYSFSSPAYPRQWNGVIHYTTPAPPPTSGSPTKLPTSFPTNRPTTKQPTNHPITSSPTRKPILSTVPPTPKPSASPSHSGTLSPTSETKSPTKSPTKSSETTPPISVTLIPTTPKPTTRMPIEPRSLTVNPTDTPEMDQTYSPTEFPTASPPPVKPTAKPTVASSSDRKKTIENVVYFFVVVVAFIM